MRMMLEKKIISTRILVLSMVEEDREHQTFFARVAEQAGGKLLYYDYAKQSPVMLDMFR